MVGWYGELLILLSWFWRDLRAYLAKSSYSWARSRFLGMFPTNSRWLLCEMVTPTLRPLRISQPLSWTRWLRPGRDSQTERETTTTTEENFNKKRTRPQERKYKKNVNRLVFRRFGLNEIATHSLEDFFVRKKNTRHRSTHSFRNSFPNLLRPRSAKPFRCQW